MLLIAINIMHKMEYWNPQYLNLNIIALEFRELEYYFRRLFINMQFFQMKIHAHARMQLKDAIFLNAYMRVRYLIKEYFHFSLCNSHTLKYTNFTDRYKYHA